MCIPVKVTYSVPSNTKHFASNNIDCSVPEYADSVRNILMLLSNVRYFNFFFFSWLKTIYSVLPNWEVRLVANKYVVESEGRQSDCRATNAAEKTDSEYRNRHGETHGAKDSCALYVCMFICALLCGFIHIIQCYSFINIVRVDADNRRPPHVRIARIIIYAHSRTRTHTNIIYYFDQNGSWIHSPLVRVCTTIASLFSFGYLLAVRGSQRHRRRWRAGWGLQTKTASGDDGTTITKHKKKKKIVNIGTSSFGSRIRQLC